MWGVVPVGPGSQTRTGRAKLGCRSEAPGAPFLASFARSGDFDPERSLRRKMAAPLDTQPAELPNFSPAPFRKTLDQRGFHHLSGGPLCSRSHLATRPRSSL